MQSITISFYNELIDPQGLPTTMNSYFVIVSDWKIKNSKIVSIVSLTSAPAVPQSHYIYENCTDEKALKKIEEILEGLEGNNDLSKWIGK